MGVIFKNGIQYSEVDGDYLPLTGGNVTGPTNFGDSVEIDELTVGNLNVTGKFGFSPFKVVQYQWQVSPAVNAGGQVGANFSPYNSFTQYEPAGYTFLCWIQMWSVGWVGALYTDNPSSLTINIWTATAKGATTGPSIAGLALYVKDELL